MRLGAASLALVVTGLSLGVSPSPGRAQDQFAASEIYVVDMQRIRNESAAGRQILQQTDDIREEIQAEIARREEDMRAAETVLAEQRDELDPSVFRERVSEFESKVIENRDYAQRETRRLQALLVTAGDKLRSEATKVVATILRERGGKLLLDSSQIVLSIDDIDITDDAIARLDRIMPRFPLASDPPPQ